MVFTKYLSLIFEQNKALSATEFKETLLIPFLSKLEIVIKDEQAIDDKELLGKELQLLINKTNEEAKLFSLEWIKAKLIDVLSNSEKSTKLNVLKLLTPTVLLTAVS